MVRVPEINASIPSVLAEVSYVSNPTEEGKLQEADYLDKNGWAIYAGVADYFGFSPKPRPTPTFTGVAGVEIQPPSNGQFQFKVISPTQKEVTIQDCEDLLNPIWRDRSTLTLLNDQCIFTDSNVSGITQRYYRTKP